MNIAFTKHAREEMRKRRIERRLALGVIESPQQVVKEKENLVYQSRYYDNYLKKEMLLRAVLRASLKSLKVITLYKTSKFEKYWKEDQHENSL